MDKAPLSIKQALTEREIDMQPVRIVCGKRFMVHYDGEWRVYETDETGRDNPIIETASEALAVVVLTTNIIP